MHIIHPVRRTRPVALLLGGPALAERDYPRPNTLVCALLRAPEQLRQNPAEAHPSRPTDRPTEGGR